MMKEKLPFILSLIGGLCFLLGFAFSMAYAFRAEPPLDIIYQRALGTGIFCSLVIIAGSVVMSGASEVSIKLGSILVILFSITALLTDLITLYINEWTLGGLLFSIIGASLNLVWRGRKTKVRKTR